MKYIKNTVNDELYSIVKKINNYNYIVNMYGQKVWIECSSTSFYKVVKI